VYEETYLWGYPKTEYGMPKFGYGYSALLIKRVQTSLKDRGYDPGAVDGSWGNKTSQALKQYQEDMQIPVTGWIDIETADMLFNGIEVHFNLAKKVQRILSEKGYNPGPVDGMWGERSKSALRRYQSDNGLYPSGLVDPKLLDLLLKD
jgi:peptidoglycan hydrolase-like protein with peptidoglycan-binding domain